MTLSMQCATDDTIHAMHVSVHTSHQRPQACPKSTAYHCSPNGALQAVSEIARISVAIRKGYLSVQDRKNHYNQLEHVSFQHSASWTFSP